MSRTITGISDNIVLLIALTILTFTESTVNLRSPDSSLLADTLGTGILETN